MDSQNIFVQGDSFGGNAAARVFTKADELRLAGVIYVCGPIDRPFLAPPEVCGELPRFTMDGVRARVGLNKGATLDVLAKRIRPVAISAQGLFEGKNITTPFLAINTNQDPVAPIEDLEKLLKRSINPTRIVLDEPGHCPSNDIAEIYASEWILRQLR